jgi:outer membrane receptor protein involved in Fe transport
MSLSLSVSRAASCGVLRSLSLALTCGALAVSAARAQTKPVAAPGEPTRLDSLVITAGRIEQAITDIAPRVEVVTARELDRTPGTYLTDLIKKNASVDLIEYPGGLAGIGLRGFRPEFSGTNQRVLVLVDGRPSGTTSLGNLPSAGVGRVEVLKGSSSALYGSSAMGGVVNFISRDSRGPLAGSVMLGGGSFSTLLADARIGGALGKSAFDFDLAYTERSQFDNFTLGRQEKTIGSFRQGGGAERPNTAFNNRSAYGRLGWQLAPAWRAELRLHGFNGHDIESPGAESDLTAAQASNNFEVAGADLRLLGRLGAHATQLVVHGTREYAVRRAETGGIPAYRASIRSTTFRGAQLQDAWTISPAYTLTYGLDYELVKNNGKTYAATGLRTRPSSPDDARETVGLFAEATAKYFDERLILSFGARRDEATNTIRATPLLPTVFEGSSSFTTTNPRAGVVFKPSATTPVRLHASAGDGFVAPLGDQLAGLSDETVSGQRRIRRGNPNLAPESSRTYDAGVGYESAAWGADLTWFRTEVSDKIESIFLTNTTALRESAWVNASTATASGFEATLEGDLGRLWSAPARTWVATASGTYFDRRDQVLPAGLSPLRNVARAKINLAVAYDDHRHFRTRVVARHVRGMIDQDNSRLLVFTGGKGGLFTYPSFVVWDLDAGWKFNAAHEVTLQVDNALDKYYYEKNDYPFAGRAIYARYRFSF